MAFEGSPADKYEGFPNAKLYENARRQRGLFRWRLLCSGADADLVNQYSKDGGLTFEEARQLSDDLRERRDVLSWKELEQKCGRSLGHFVAGSKTFRVPSPETLAAMAEVGGEAAVTEMLRHRRLSERERQRLHSAGLVSASALRLAGLGMQGELALGLNELEAAADSHGDRPTMPNQGGTQSASDGLISRTRPVRGSDIPPSESTSIPSIWTAWMQTAAGVMTVRTMQTSLINTHPIVRRAMALFVR